VSPSPPLLISYQGPFSANQLSEWNSAGYLDKHLHVRKRSTIKGMNGGAFLELQKFYDETHGDRPFEQNSKMTISNSVNMLDKLIQTLGRDTSVYAATAAQKSVNSMGPVRQQPAKVEKSQSEWIEMTDPNSGAIYYYNTESGASSWEKPSEE
jgi:hypothetical protein